MRETLAVVALAAIAAELAPPALHGQVLVGAHSAFTSYQNDGGGGGVRVGLDLPLLPLDVVGVVDVFSPVCSQTGCSLRGASLDGNLRLPIPVVRPYVTGGLSYRKGHRSQDGETIAETGLNLGAGLDVDLGIRLFADVRYEFLDEFEGSVARIGLIFDL